MTRKSRSRPRAVEETAEIGGAADRRWLAAILAGYLVLALVYNLVTPMGASPDEGPHADYVRFLVERRQFPVFGSEPGLTYEAHQPPLYYLLAVPVWVAAGALAPETPAVAEEAPVSPADGAQPQSAVRPEAGTGSPDSAVRGKAVRVLTTLMGGVGLLLIWALARVMYRKDRWLPLAAMAFAAFLPMRLATAAAVTNDVLLEALFTAALLAMALMIRQGYTQRRALALGGAMGAALLTKATGILLLPAALMAIMLAARVRDEEAPSAEVRAGSRSPTPAPPRARLDARAFFGGCLLAFGLTAILAGPWLLRNQLRYGDFLGQQLFEQYFQNTSNPRREQFLAGGRMTNAGYWFTMVVPWTYRSFWGMFGHMSIPMPGKLYLALLVPTGLAFVGVILHFLRARHVLDETQRSAWIVSVLCLLLVISGFLRFNTVFFQAQARYLTPAMAPIALLTVVGWFVFVPVRARPTATLGIALAMAVLAVYAAFGVIVPYFA